MTQQELQALQLLEAQYYSLSGAYNALLNAAAAAPPNQIATLKQQAGDALNEANENWVDAQNRILNEPADLIAALIQTASDAQKQIDDALQDLTNIKATLNAITNAVKTVAIVVARLT